MFSDVGDFGVQLGDNCFRLTPSLRELLFLRQTAPFGMDSNLKACNLNTTLTMPLVYAIGYCPAIFVMAGIAFSHCMSTWYSSPNIEERYVTETLSSGSKSCSRKFALTSGRNSSRGTVRPNTYTGSSTTLRSTRCRAWLTVSKAFPVGWSVSSGLILRTLLEECPVVAVLLCRQLRRGTAGHHPAIR